MAKFFLLVAKSLFPFRKIILLLVLLLAGALGYLLLFAAIAIQQQYMLMTFLALLWSLLLFVLVTSFAKEQQAPVITGLTAKLLWRIKRLLLSLYALFFVVLLVLTLYFTLRISTI